jgi:outer membrane receptor for monomeric catechols
MTIRFPRSTGNLLPLVAITALTASVVDTATAAEEQANSRADATVMAQADQTSATEQPADKTELSIEKVIARVEGARLLGHRRDRARRWPVLR